MPAHKRSERILKDVQLTVEKCLSEGYFPPDLPSKGRPAHTEAAIRLSGRYGWPVETAWKWIGAATRDTDYRPDYSKFRPYQYQSHDYVHKQAGPVRPDGGKRVAIIGDAHDSPCVPDKSRFKWMGRWIAEHDFDEVWQVGDFCTLDSLTRHAAPGTLEFGNLPSFKNDLDSLNEALEAFRDGLQGRDIPLTITLGNHENRAHRYEDNNPQMAGTVVGALEGAFSGADWRTIPFGEIAFIEGVGITHHPINTNGKAMTGETANHRTGKSSTFSLIHGHDHVRNISHSPKIGPMGHVDVVSVGCSLPWGVVERYASHGPSGWWWGVTAVNLSQGQILDMNFTSMLKLESSYGD